MKEQYLEFNFRASSLKLIDIIDGIVEDYVAQGYRLTVRQIYYQLVALGIIENSVKSYDNTQALLNNARLAGLIDWDAIEDTTRELTSRPKWKSGAEILEAAARSYHEDLWSTQDSRVFVIVEKAALHGILDRVCKEWDAPLLAARGYPSATTLRELAKERILGCEQRVVLLHLGDHDPSGIDMSRDLLERIEMFSRMFPGLELRRIALNMNQIEELKPPPNPAKTTDARYAKYLEMYGNESWELDALKPQYIHNLVSEQMSTLVDMKAWGERVAEVEVVRERLQAVADEFDLE